MLSLQARGKLSNGMVIVLVWLFGFHQFSLGQSLLPDTSCGNPGVQTYYVAGWTGSTYTWSVEEGQIIPPGNTETITVDWSGVPPGSYAISVTEHSANGCSGDPFTDTVIIFPAPEIDFSLCWPVTSRDAKPVVLKGAIPLNGIYSGTGVQNGIFDPALVPPGQDTVIIRYHYTNDFGCPDADSAILQLLPASNHICGNPFTDVRDGMVYPTVQIGTQCWMAENLRFGSQITTPIYQRDNCLPEKYCYHETTANCTLYGGLYQWDEVMEYQDSDPVQGLCPPGWHIPSEAEWQQLFALYIAPGFAGNPLKETGYSGFNAQLEGFLASPQSWNYGSNNTTLNSSLFWTSTPSGEQKAIAHGINTVLSDPTWNTGVSSYSAFRHNGCAVRCVKD